jgi:hypothetical protein
LGRQDCPRLNKDEKKGLRKIRNPFSFMVGAAGFEPAGAVFILLKSLNIFLASGQS